MTLKPRTLSAVTVPAMAVAFIGLDRSAVLHASILTRVAQQIGGSFGTAVVAVILAATHSFDRAFWWTVGFTAVAVALSFLLPGRPAPAEATAPAPGAGGANRTGGGQATDAPAGAAA